MVSGLIMTMWCMYFLKKTPTTAEFKVITATYGFFMTVVTISPAFFAKSPTLPGLLTLALYAIAYVGFFSITFNEKLLTSLVNKST